MKRYQNKFHFVYYGKSRKKSLFSDPKVYVHVQRAKYKCMCVFIKPDMRKVS